MAKVLIAYFSPGGETQKMASYVGEGIRFTGAEPTVTEISDIHTFEDVAGYDGYILGAPTYSLDVPEDMKNFLSGLPKTSLKNKLAGAFGPFTHDVSYSHDTHAPAIMFKTMQDSKKMKPFELGPLILREDMVETNEGIRACQEYGRVFGKALQE
jgi:flavodoxin